MMKSLKIDPNISEVIGNEKVVTTDCYQFYKASFTPYTFLMAG